MTWTNYPYCTLTQVKNALGLSSSYTDDDAWISDDLIPEAQEFIDSYIGYMFQTNGSTGSPVTNVYDGNDTGRLMIDYLISFSQVLETVYDVVLGSDGIFSIQTTATNDITADCFLGPNSTVNKYGYGYYLQRVSMLPFQLGTQNYAVKGVWGRQPIPNQITRACIRLAAHYYKMRDTNYADSLTEQNSIRLRYYKPCPLDVLEILDQFRRRRFGSGSSTYQPFL